MNKVTVTIQGSEYPMVGDKSEKEMVNIANYVNAEMEKIKSNSPNLGLFKISILTSLNLADLLFECSEENEKLLKRIDELEEELKKPNKEVEQKILELNNLISAKEKELAESKFEVERLNGIISDQEIKIDSLSNVTEQSKAEVEKCKAEVEQMKVQLESAVEEEKSATNLSTDWQNRCYGLQFEITRLEDEIKKLKSEK